jgi:rubredoxin
MRLCKVSTMPQIVSHEEVKGSRTQRDVQGGQHQVGRTDFIAAPKERPDLPQAFLIDTTAGRRLPTHFHEVDQFQVVVKGDGRLAQHELATGGVHFARRFTPYGAITMGKQGLSFMTLRARRDPGKAQFIPERLSRLEEVKDRRPWQATCMAQFRPPVGGVALDPIAGLQDGRGLAGWSLSLEPGAQTVLPSAAASDGQFLVALEGSLEHGGRLHPQVSVAYVASDEPPMTVVAGPQGLKAVLLNFPVPQSAGSGGADNLRGAATDGRAWHCELCNFIYDETTGLPEQGIAPGTPWAEIPDEWKCPDCEATKKQFEPVEF